MERKKRRTQKSRHDEDGSERALHRRQCPRDTFASHRFLLNHRFGVQIPPGRLLGGFGTLNDAKLLERVLLQRHRRRAEVQRFERISSHFAPCERRRWRIGFGRFGAKVLQTMRRRCVVLVRLQRRRRMQSPPDPFDRALFVRMLLAAVSVVPGSGSLLLLGPRTVVIAGRFLRDG